MEEISAFNIKTEVFEGPLDLLLDLIEKRKLLINDVSLSQVADNFIEYIKIQGSLPVAETAHFILVASTLLLIKSKSLLPSMELTEEEEASIEDLETRLKLYKRFKELSLHIEKKFGKKIIFSKNPSKNIPVVFSPEPDMKVGDILTAARDIIANLPKPEMLPKAIVLKVMSLEEMIGKLTERISSNLKMSFGEFAKSQSKTQNKGARHKGSREDRLHVIVSFLAMLELVKQGIIDVSQQSISDDIDIESQTLSIPKYS
jgi:segregation and condensation protein A